MNNLFNDKPFSQKGVIFYPYKDFWAAVSWTSNNIMFLEKISDNNIEDVINKLSPKYEPLPPIWRGLCLYITTKCNLDCLYCYAKGGDTSNTMSWEIAKTSINYFKNCNPNILSLTFHGAGEPTLEINFIKKCCEYIESINIENKPIRYNIVTNGVISDSTLQWLINKKFRFSISVDGIPEVQDKQRPLRGNKKSSFFVEKTIKKIVNSGLPYSINGVFTNETYHLMEDSVRYFSNLGAKYIRLRHAFICGRCHDNEIKEIDLDNYLNYLINAKSLASSLGIKIAIPGYNMPFPHRCGIASGYFAGVSYEGFVTGCTEVTSKNHPAYEIFYFGYVDTKQNTVVLDEQKIEKYRNRSYNQIPECKECFMRDYCNGGCMIRCWEYSNDINKPDPSECKRSKELFISYIHEIVEMSIQKHFNLKSQKSQ